MDYNEEKSSMEDEDFDAHKGVQKLNRNNRFEGMTLLKLKISKTDTLIRQYNDKMKECNLLNEELSVVKNENQDTLRKYNQTMEKLTRIELSNSNYKESLETFKNLSENQKIKLDENGKHINQLLYKIQEMEQQVETLQELNKTLDRENKFAKASTKIAEKKSVKLKHQESQTLMLKTQEISVNTDPAITWIPKKLEDKNVATDDCSYGKKEPFPIFCSKCEVLIDPAPINQILKIMTFNPPLLSEYHTPPNSPIPDFLSEHVPEPIETISLNEIKNNENNLDPVVCSRTTSFNETKNNENNLDPVTFSRKKHTSSANVTKEIKHSSFMEIDLLHRKISNLENLMKKEKGKRKKEYNCCLQTCCSSKKNIKFVVELPNQKQMFGYRKREKREQKILKNSKRKQNILKSKSSSTNKWKIENCLDLNKKRKLSSGDLENKSKRILKKKKILSKEQNSLFECQEDVFSSDEMEENDNCSVESLSPSNLLESQHPDTLSSNTNMDTNLDLIEKSEQDVNVNQHIIKSKMLSHIPRSSQTLVFNTSCPNNLEKESNNLPGAISAIGKMSKKDDISYSDCNLELRIENKETNEHLDNSGENLEISSTSQLSNKISDSMKQNTSTTSKVVQLQDNKSLSSIKNINENFTCTSNVEESEKFGSNVKEEYKNSKNKNINSDEQIASQVLHETSITLKMMNLEKEKQNPLNTKSLAGLPLIKKPEQKVHTCSEIPKGTEALNQSANNELVNSDDLSDLQIQILEKGDSSCLEISKSLELLSPSPNNELENSDDLSNLQIQNIEQDNSLGSEIAKATEVLSQSANNEVENSDDLSDLQIQNTDKDDSSCSEISKSPEVLSPSANNELKNSDELSGLQIRNIVQDNSLCSEITKATEVLSQSAINESVNSNNLADLQIQNTDKDDSLCSEVPKVTEVHQSSNNKSRNSDVLSDSQIQNTDEDDSSTEVENNNDNAIVSEESSQEFAESPASPKPRALNRRTQKKTTRKKKLLTIIRNIRKNNQRPITAKKLDSSVSQVTDKSCSASVESLENKIPMEKTPKDQNSVTDNTLVDLPTIKQRIAHRPKSYISFENDLKTKKSKVSVEKTRNKTKIAKETEENGDKISSILEDYDKTCKERIEIEKNLKALNPPIMDFSLLSSPNKVILKEDANSVSNSKELSQDLKNNTLQENLILDKNYSNSTIKTSFIEEGKKQKEVKAPTMELRSRHLSCNKDASTFKATKLTKPPVKSKIISKENSRLNNSLIGTALNNVFANTSNINRRNNTKENTKNGTFVEKQLELLMQAEWTREMNSKITENLLNTLGIRNIALFLIEYICETMVDEEFDKSHTPPAPIMTRSEQKVITLISSIDKINNKFTDLINEGLSYKLFRLGKPHSEEVVERLIRILVVLNKIRKDREKVRIFLCDALYCFNLRAINVIYIVLTCWAEVLPKYNSNNDILVKTLVHIVMSLQLNKPYPKLISLKKLLTSYYEYPNNGYNSIALKEELLKKLQESVPGVSTAILLLSKKMGPSWSLEKIINDGLRQMIIASIVPHEALSLLGHILRSFPKTDANNNVAEIVDQLCHVLDSNTKPDDVQESILSCLLSIGVYHKYEQIALSVIKWQTNEKDLRDITKEKLYSFLKVQSAQWWSTFVNANSPFAKPESK